MSSIYFLLLENESNLLKVFNNHKNNLPSYILDAFIKTYDKNTLIFYRFKEKEDIGITFTKTGGYQYFRGLKQKSYDIEEVSRNVPRNVERNVEM